MKERFEIRYLDEAAAFLRGISDKDRIKIYYNIKRAQLRLDPELFKKLNEDIWEFRTLYNRKQYRLFAFWDKDENALVVATHGIIKKTDKTPLGDLNKAISIKKNYFDEKKKKTNKKIRKI